MRYHFRWAVLLLVFAAPVSGQDDQKKQNSDKYKPTKADYDALIKAKQVVGVLKGVEGSGKGFTLQYTYQYLVPRPDKINAKDRNLARRQQSLVNEYNSIMRIKDPARQARRLNEFALKVQRMQLSASDLNNLFYTKTGRKDFELQATDDTKVRLMKLPVRYDDKGNPKEYTAEEKKELKGKDPKLPGYAATWDNVSDGRARTKTRPPRTRRKTRTKTRPSKTKRKTRTRAKPQRTKTRTITSPMTTGRW